MKTIDAFKKNSAAIYYVPNIVVHNVIDYMMEIIHFINNNRM